MAHNQRSLTFEGGGEAETVLLRVCVEVEVGRGRGGYSASEAKGSGFKEDRKDQDDRIASSAAGMERSVAEVKDPERKSRWER